MSNKKQEAAYHFFVNKEIARDSFTVKEILEITDWKESTFKTYLRKKWKKIIIKKANDTYIVQGVSQYSVEEWFSLMSQKSLIDT